MKCNFYIENNSLIIIPSTKVGQSLSTTTKEISPVIIKNSEQLYDDATLGVIKKANNIAPNFTNKYILDSKNSLKIIGGVEVANDIFNDSTPIPSSVKGTIGSTIYNIEKELKSLVENKSNEK